jgi:hypothetical protein
VVSQIWKLSDSTTLELMTRRRERLDPCLHSLNGQSVYLLENSDDVTDDNRVCESRRLGIMLACFLSSLSLVVSRVYIY